jgi:hypothetical protein
VVGSTFIGRTLGVAAETATAPIATADLQTIDVLDTGRAGPLSLSCDGAKRANCFTGIDPVSPLADWKHSSIVQRSRATAASSFN